VYFVGCHMVGLLGTVQSGPWGAGRRQCNDGTRPTANGEGRQQGTPLLVEPAAAAWAQGRTWYAPLAPFVVTMEPRKNSSLASKEAWKSRSSSFTCFGPQLYGRWYTGMSNLNSEPSNSWLRLVCRVSRKSLCAVGAGFGAGLGEEDMKGNLKPPRLNPPDPPAALRTTTDATRALPRAWAGRVRCGCDAGRAQRLKMRDSNSPGPARAGAALACEVCTVDSIWRGRCSQAVVLSQLGQCRHVARNRRRIPPGLGCKCGAHLLLLPQDLGTCACCSLTYPRTPSLMRSSTSMSITRIYASNQLQTLRTAIGMHALFIIRKLLRGGGPLQLISLTGGIRFYTPETRVPLVALNR
jgi:hypothetical protein